MRTLFLLIAVSCLPWPVFAQSNGLVKGKLTDTVSRQPLVGATVSIVHNTDSSLIDFSITDKQGMFEVANLAKGNYKLITSYTGFIIYKKEFSISAVQPVADLGEIIMAHDYKTLPGVVVSDVNPVKIHGDTISFKADAFTSKPGATVEDVLKKLPGIQVQKDGTVRAMGETVQKVYVDGKEFFANDPKIATKNITADMVDQVQVFDDMSEQARFTKIDDGNRTKSINIKLKKDKSKGEFGRVTGGVGTESRYDGNLFVNHFLGQRRISLVGSVNNTNKINYTFNNPEGGGTTLFTNGGNSNAGFITASSSISPGGVSSPFSTGMNYDDKWGDKVDFRASYFYSDNNNLLRQNKFRQNTFPGDSISEVKTLNEIRNQNKNHRVNARWEFFIDSMNSLLYNINMQWQQSNGSTIETGNTMSYGIDTFLAITNQAAKEDKREGMNYNGELLYRKRFHRPGRTFTLGWRNNSSNNNGYTQNNSPVTSYFPNGSVDNFLHLNQQVTQDNESGNNSLSTSYTEPVGTGKLLELNYSWTLGNNMTDKKTYDYDSLSEKYSQENLQLTNYFKYRNSSNRMGINFRQQKKKYNYQLGMAVQFTNLENRNRDGSGDKDTVINQLFINLFPSANLNYIISRTKSIRVAYRGRTNSPTPAQLQDVPDVNNPLHIKTGNPNLKPELVNNLNIHYQSYKLSNQMLLTANMNMTYTGNKIVNSMDSAASVVMIYKPENLNGSFNTVGSVSLNIPFRKLRNTSLNLSNNTYVNRDASLLFGKKNYTTIFVMNQSAGFGISREKFDLSVSGAAEFNKVTYDMDGNSDNHYLNQSYSADFSYRFKYNFYWLTDFDYYITTGRTEGYNQHVFLWNMSAAKKLLKNNAFEIKVTAYDILRQNKGINRFIGENYFEDIRSNVVPRFFLLSISYNFNRMGNRKKPTDDLSAPERNFK